MIEHTVRIGDRLDLLARHYYNDGRQWWRILDANPEFLHADDAVLGKTLVQEGDRLVEVDRPEAGAVVVRPSMVGRVIVIPRARE